MSKSSFLIFLIILALAQTVLATFFSIRGGVPNLFILALVWLSIYHPGRGRESWILAIAGGLFLDLFAGTFFGLHLISLLILRAGLKILLDTFLPREENLLLVVGLLLISIAAYQLVFFLANSLFAYWRFADYLDSSRFFGIGLLWQFLYSLLIFYPVSLFSKKILSRKA